MKILKNIMFLLILMPLPLKAIADETISLAEDFPVLQVAMRSILKGTNHQLYFVDKDSRVEMDFENNRFNIFIAKSDYEESGTIEGALALTCHEMGHVAEATADGVSSEEDADYWAGKICLWQMFKIFPRKVSSKKTPFDFEFIKSCEKFSSNEEKELCERGLRAGYFFRNAKEYQICNSQDLFFRDGHLLAKTPIIGKRAPHG
ncbi:MAG: hypothetical protein K2Q18_18780, partial [Bdellovibrionales bacterium]|nr:hypothetical protein [Bdellovibrionales bacterium]